MFEIAGRLEAPLLLWALEYLIFYILVCGFIKWNFPLLNVILPERGPLHIMLGPLPLKG